MQRTERGGGPIAIALQSLTQSSSEDERFPPDFGRKREIPIFRRTFLGSTPKEAIQPLRHLFKFRPFPQKRKRLFYAQLL
jgi:hypothetical protein